MAKYKYKTENSALFNKNIKKDLGGLLKQQNNGSAAKIAQFGDKHIVNLPLESIIVNEQVRKTFVDEDIETLATNINKQGLLHPIIVKSENLENSQFKLITGENRLRAFRLLRKETIPALVKESSISDDDIQIIQLSENIIRSQLCTIEKTTALMDIKNRKKLTLKELSSIIGLSLATLKQYSRIYNLPAKDKAYHLKNRTSFDAIIRFLKAKNEAKSIVPIPSYKQEPLFNLNETSVKLKGFNLNLKKTKPKDILKTIQEYEDILQKIKNHVKQQLSP